MASRTTSFPLYDVMHMTGYKSLTMVQRYSHLASEFQERAIEALNKYSHNLVTLDLDGSNSDPQKHQNPLVSQGVLMVEPRGFEPLTSTMPGMIESADVTQGKHVEAGDLLATIEAMKMEIAIRSEQSGIIAWVVAGAGT